MRNSKWLIFCVAFALIAGTAGALSWTRSNQKLGQPGILTAPIPGSAPLKINLPERVLDFTSTNVPEPAVVLGYLPPDTSYAERIYTAPDGFWVQNAVVLMGADRTSIHNAEYCLGGQGFSITAKSTETISIPGNPAYPLSVSRWNVAGDFARPDGQKTKYSGVYVFWFVAEGEETSSHFQIIKRMTLNLLTTGVLQRWAYVLYFAPCAGGQEDATFERMKQLISHAVPEYQKPPARPAK